MKKIYILILMTVLAYGASAQDSLDGGIMDVSRGELVLNGRNLNDADVKGLLGQSGYETWASARKQRSLGRTCIIIGGVGTLAGVTMIAAGALGGDAKVVAAIGIIPLLAGEIGLPIGFVLSGAGNGRLNWLADTYNKGGSLSQNISVSFCPSLVCAPSATGNTYGLGAGFQLTF
ncbi:MAG: hypothetical protein J6X88_09560 [Bacteroidales bacterium]|nr:hypothetical protein [Bacteroidales bacterium]